MTTRDWTQPVLELLVQLQDQGLELISVDDGEERLKPEGNDPPERRLSIAKAITSVDASWLLIGKRERKATLFIVLGNEPDELVADWTASPWLNPLIEVAVDRHRQIWEGVPCPLIENSND